MDKGGLERALTRNNDWGRRIAIFVVALAAGTTTFFLLIATFDTREPEQTLDAALE